MEPQHPVVVHLIHGTWPFGPFRKKPKSGDKKAWFEEGSQVRAGILKAISIPVEFRDFRWSGRNSFAARASASRQLHAHLQQALAERPDTRHVIVAHSHGGNVAARTLSDATDAMPTHPRIKALVCLATPFAYRSELSNAQAFAFHLSCSFVLTAFALMSAIFAWPATRLLHPAVFFFLAFWLPPLLAAIMLFFTHTRRTRDYLAGTPIHHKIPVFLVRATRDEAALVIGLAQSLHSLTAKLYQEFQRIEFRSLGSLLFSLGITSLFFIPVVLAAKLFYLVAGDLGMGPWRLAWMLCLLCSAWAAMIFIASYAVLALSAGFNDFRMWHSSLVEVDAVPPGKQCQFKAYNHLGTVETTSLRHGIYNLEEVQTEIGQLIQMVGLGQEPRLVTQEQLDAEKDRQRGATRLARFMGKEDLHWGEMDPSEQYFLREDLKADATITVPLSGKRDD